MEILIALIMFGVLAFLMLLSLAWVWVREHQNRSILVPLLLTFGILIVFLLLAFGIILNWDWVWDFISFWS